MAKICKGELMKSLVIFTSIRDTLNFKKYAQNFAEYKQEPDVIVIDEDGKNRGVINEQFIGVKDLEYFGAEERQGWFNSHKLKEYAGVIPQKAHNENSFGLLVALERGGYDMIVFLDDDTYPAYPDDFLGEHWRCLNSEFVGKRNFAGYWVNTHPEYYVRGYPYNQRFTTEGLQVEPNNPTVLHMGCWSGIPDLNAVDYLVFNAQNKPRQIDVRNFKVAKKQFAPICSMNVAFKPEIIPAYYQLWHRDRYDDVFSGLFLKKITDYLGRDISVGSPVCYHDKAPRNLFKDAATELSSMELNEELWKALLQIELTEETWLGCYRELAVKLRKTAKPLNPTYILKMTEKMLLWCDLIEKVSA